MQYEAFISYSHRDEKWAAWIQRSLEGFRIPKKLVQELDLAGNRFLPLFRDKDELASSAHLSDTLRDALAASRNLIVVCSPAAAQSRWVDAEVAAFQALGRGQRVICVIVDGDPGVPSTCFPASLRALEPLAVDLRAGHDSRRSARLKLAASLLGTGYDRLRQRDSQRRRRRLVSQLLVTTVAAVAIAAVSYRVAMAPPCRDSAARLAAIWNPQVQERIRRAFLASGLPYAEDSWDRIRLRFDRFSADWSVMHRDACEATLVRAEQSPQLMDLRMACLDERRTEFAGLAGAFEHADAQLVARAVDAAGELRGLTRCADREQLLAAYPLPEDPARRAQIEALRDQLAANRSQLSAGRLDQVRGGVDGFVALARQYEFPPLEAEALLLRSSVELQSGRSAAAKEALYAAAAKAVQARDNELIARAWIALAMLLVENEADPEEAQDVLQLAQSYIAQLPARHPLEARFHDARARALATVGSYQQVLKDEQVAVDISRSGNDPALPVYLARLANMLGHMHRLDEAQAVANEAIVMADEIFGRQHPSYAAALVAAAGVATLRGKHGEALRLREQVLQITEAAYPPGHPALADVLERLAWSLKENGRYAEAIAAAERALGLERAFETPRWAVLSTVQNTLGDVYISLGNYDLAMQALQAALRAVRKSGNKPQVGLALNNLGNAANRAGDHAAAEAYCRDALDIDETYLAADHPDLGYALSCIGEALLGAGKPDQALAPLRRAHGVRDRLDIAVGSLAWTRWLYGRALWESGADRSLGLTYVTFARRVFLEMGESARSELADVETWLTAHDLAAG